MKDTSALTETPNREKPRQIVVSGNAHAAAKDMAMAYDKDIGEWVGEVILAACEAAPPEIHRAIRTLKNARARVTPR